MASPIYPCLDKMFQRAFSGLISTLVAGLISDWELPGPPGREAGQQKGENEGIKKMGQEEKDLIAPTLTPLILHNNPHQKV